MRIIVIFWLVIACLDIAFLSRFGDTLLLPNLNCVAGNFSEIVYQLDVYNLTLEEVQCGVYFLGNDIHRYSVKFWALFVQYVEIMQSSYFYKVPVIFYHCCVLLLAVDLVYTSWVKPIIKRFFPSKKKRRSRSRCERKIEYESDVYLTTSSSNLSVHMLFHASSSLLFTSEFEDEDHGKVEEQEEGFILRRTRSFSGFTVKERSLFAGSSTELITFNRLCRSMTSLAAVTVCKGSHLVRDYWNLRFRLLTPTPSLSAVSITGTGANIIESSSRRNSLNGSHQGSASSILSEEDVNRWRTRIHDPPATDVNHIINRFENLLSGRVFRMTGDLQSRENEPEAVESNEVRSQDKNNITTSSSINDISRMDVSFRHVDLGPSSSVGNIVVLFGSEACASFEEYEESDEMFSASSKHSESSSSESQKISEEGWGYSISSGSSELSFKSYDFLHLSRSSSGNISSSALASSTIYKSAVPASITSSDSRQNQLLRGTREYVFVARPSTAPLPWVDYWLRFCCYGNQASHGTDESDSILFGESVDLANSIQSSDESDEPLAIEDIMENKMILSSSDNLLEDLIGEFSDHSIKIDHITQRNSFMINSKKTEVILSETLPPIVNMIHRRTWGSMMELRHEMKCSPVYTSVPNIHQELGMKNGVEFNVRIVHCTVDSGKDSGRSTSVDEPDDTIDHDPIDSIAFLRQKVGRRKQSLQDAVKARIARMKAKQARRLKLFFGYEKIERKPRKVIRSVFLKSLKEEVYKQVLIPLLLNSAKEVLFSVLT